MDSFSFHHRQAEPTVEPHKANDLLRMILYEYDSTNTHFVLFAVLQYTNNECTNYECILMYVCRRVQNNGSK